MSVSLCVSQRVSSLARRLTTCRVLAIRHVIGTSHASQRDDEVFTSKLSSGIVVRLALSLELHSMLALSGFGSESSEWRQFSVASDGPTAQ